MTVTGTAEHTIDTRFQAAAHGPVCHAINGDASCASVFDVKDAFQTVPVLSPSAPAPSKKMVEVAKPAAADPAPPAPAAAAKASVEVVKPAAAAATLVPEAIQSAVDKTPANASKMFLTGKHLDPVTRKATACEGVVVDKAAGTVTTFRCPAKKGVCPTKLTEGCVLDTPIALGSS